MKFNTLLLHGNFSADARTGGTTPPIYQSASFQFATAEDLENVFQGKRPGFVYTRINNPTIESFERRLTLLEGGVGAVACASGMAAVSLAVMNIVKSGDEIVSGSGIFGGTYSFFKCLEEFGVVTQYAQGSDLASFEKCINSKTRLIFVETIGNPQLSVANIRALAELAEQKGIPLIVDNTATTPYLVKPIELGAHVVVHSTTKFINGNGNSVGGIIVDSGKFKWNLEKFPSFKEYKKFGPFAYLAKLRKGIFKDFGPCTSPFNIYLTSIGLETLGLRMDRQCSNAQRLAECLQQNSKVLAVNYPGLTDNPYYALAKSQFNGRFGAILTIRVGSKEKAFTVINSLKYAANVANIGDARTLVIHPASTIYAANSPEEQENAGVYEDLIRISVGLEDFEDIQADFEQALAKVANS